MWEEFVKIKLVVHEEFNATRLTKNIISQDILPEIAIQCSHTLVSPWRHKNWMVCKRTNCQPHPTCNKKYQPGMYSFLSNYASISDTCPQQYHNHAICRRIRCSNLNKYIFEIALISLPENSVSKLMNSDSWIDYLTKGNNSAKFSLVTSISFCYLLFLLIY